MREEQRDDLVGIFLMFYARQVNASREGRAEGGEWWSLRGGGGEDEESKEKIRVFRSGISSKAACRHLGRRA